MKPVWIFDFDSTIIDTEALDVLVEIIEMEEPAFAKERKLKHEIDRITKAAMNGELTFDVALQQRIDLLSIRPEWLEKLTKLLLKRIGYSFLKQKAWLEANKDRIYIISGGFEDYIIPVAEHLGLKASHVIANKFVLKENGILTFDDSQPLSKAMGKVIALNSLKLEGILCMVGDGYTDYETKLHKAVSKFFLYAEHVNRSHIITDSDQVVFSLSEIITLDNG